MKNVLIFLLFPFYALGQTVHVKDDRVFYEGKVQVTGLSSSDILYRLQQAMEQNISNYEMITASNDSIKAKGQFRLRTPHPLVRTVNYIITLKPNDEGYEYSIDSVSMKEKKRGFGTVTKSSKEILEKMEDFGKEAEQAERILNETDMRIQQLLVLLRKGITSGNASASLR